MYSSRFIHNSSNRFERYVYASSSSAIYMRHRYLSFTHAAPLFWPLRSRWSTVTILPSPAVLLKGTVLLSLLKCRCMRCHPNRLAHIQYRYGRIHSQCMGGSRWRQGIFPWSKVRINIVRLVVLSVLMRCLFDCVTYNVNHACFISIASLE